MKTINFLFLLLIPCAALAGDGHIRRPVTAVPNRYIVKLNDDVAPNSVAAIASEVAATHNGTIRRVWPSVVPAFAIEVREAAAIAISHRPDVEFVEQEGYWTLSAIQYGAPWNLDRIDQRGATLSGNYVLGCESVLNSPIVYVLDSGVRQNHQEFAPLATDPPGTSVRVLSGYNALNDAWTETNPCTGAWACGFGDPTCTIAPGGHGTAVASIIAGTTYGVAKRATIVPVRINGCDGPGYTTYLLSGLEYIFNDYPSRRAGDGHQLPAVVNYSGGIGMTDPNLNLVEMWINKLINERGVTVVTSANNTDEDAANWSPARLGRGGALAGKVITVGGTTRISNDSGNPATPSDVTSPSVSADRRWKCNPNRPTTLAQFEVCGNGVIGSNYGSSVSIFAPAQDVRAATIKEMTSPYSDSTTAERVGNNSGTSFSAAIVSGMVARILYAVTNPTTATPDAVWNTLLADATTGALSENPADPYSGPLYNSQNRFVYRYGATVCRP